jgi:hypothetical protein
MSFYIGGLITIISTAQSVIANQNTILTEAGDDILTENDLPLLTES